MVQFPARPKTDAEVHPSAIGRMSPFGDTFPRDHVLWRGIETSLETVALVVKTKSSLVPALG